jgi:hypothetical protein
MEEAQTVKGRRKTTVVSLLQNVEVTKTEDEAVVKEITGRARVRVISEQNGNGGFLMIFIFVKDIF